MRMRPSGEGDQQMREGGTDEGEGRRERQQGIEKGIRRE